MTYTAYVTNMEHFNIFFTAILTPMFLFGGVFFPFDQLPAWAQVIGWCLPLSHLVAATRDLTLGGADLATLGHIGALVLVAAALIALPVRRLGRTLLR
jgi:lipooligosaccharide transport system permease protein